MLFLANGILNKTQSWRYILAETHSDCGLMSSAQPDIPLVLCHPRSHFVPLFEGVFGRFGWKYIAYRLKYFANITWIKVLAHLIEFYLIYHLLGKASLAAVAVLRGVFFTIKAGYWGFLEILRSRIRAQYQENTQGLIASIVQKWLILAFFVGLLASIVYSLLPITHHSLFIVVFSISMCVELTLQLMVFTFHSSTFALRRIVRPSASIYSLYVMELTLLVIMWPLLGIFSVPASQIITRFTSFYLTYHYVKRSNDTFSTDDRLPKHKITLSQSFSGVLSLESLAATLAAIVMHSEGAIILLLFVMSLSNIAHADTSVIFFFLISPIILSSFSWARLFYFDFKRLEFFPLTSLCQKLLSNTFKVSFFIGLLFWGLACLVALLVYSPGIQYLLVLLPFFLLRSPIAILQLHAFSMRRYLDVILSGCLILLSLLALALTNASTHFVLFLVVILMTFSLLYLLFITTKTIKYQSGIFFPLTFYDWLKSYAKSSDTCNTPEVFLIQFDRSLSRFQTFQLAKKLSKFVGQRGAVTLYKRGHCLLYMNSDSKDLYSYLCRVAAGCVTHIEPANLDALLHKRDKNNSLSLQSICQKRFQDALVMPVGHAFLLPSAVSFPQLQRSIYALTKNPLAVITIAEFYLSIAVDDHGIQEIYLIPQQSASIEDFLNWQSLTVSRNYLALVSNRLQQDTPESFENIPSAVV